MCRKKSQVSVEYMMIIGFVTLITIPLVLIYHSFVQDSSDEIISSQVRQIAQKIAHTAESVYYLGEPSQATLNINMPDMVIGVNMSAGYEIVFKVLTGSGTADIVQSSAVNITGSLPVNKSAYAITLEAKSGHVEVSYK
ncbi:hypothetical protein HYU09_05130 [Candidatus Woesearchaeota archaeon]|nr:hypothetical protein [Candidatus Woesearchaeota archaeon]